MGKTTKKRTKKFVNKNLQQALKLRKETKKKNRNKRNLKPTIEEPEIYPQTNEVEKEIEMEGDEVGQHISDLENLKDTQKDFFEFLEKEGSDLLKFDISEDSDNKNEEEVTPVNELTSKILEKLKKKSVGFGYTCDQGFVGSISHCLSY